MLTIYGYLPEVQKCVNCDSAKRLCTAKKKDFEFMTIADSKDEDGTPIFNENLEKVLKQLGRDSPVGLQLPIIFNSDVYIGSFNELRKIINTL